MASMLLFCIHFMYYTVAMERSLFDDGYDHWVPPPPPIFLLLLCSPSNIPLSNIRHPKVWSLRTSYTHIPLNGKAQRLEGSALNCGRWKHNNNKRVTVGSIHWDPYWGRGIVEYCDIREQKSLFLTLSTVFTVWLTVTCFIVCI